jgi:hypothetical protein
LALLWRYSSIVSQPSALHLCGRSVSWQGHINPRKGPPHIPTGYIKRWWNQL